MIIRYPFMRAVDPLAAGAAPAYAPTFVMRDWDRDMVWVAPRWLAWLYRHLPQSVVVQNRPEHETPGGAFFLWSIRAGSWQIAWMPARRRPEVGLPYLVIWSRVTGDTLWGLPWGKRFVVRRAQAYYAARRAEAR